MKGEGLPKDDVMAYAWLNVSGIKFEDARKLRDKLAQSMSQQSIEEAQKMSRELQARIDGRAK